MDTQPTGADTLASPDSSSGGDDELFNSLTRVLDGNAKQQGDAVTSANSDGYVTTPQDGPAPGFSGLVVGPPDQLGQGMIEYQDSGGKHLVLQSGTPELYASLKEAYADMAGGNDAVTQAQADGYTLAGSDTQAPALTDITSWQGGDLINTPDGTLEYETGAGKVIVDKTLTPELYKQVQQELAQRNTLSDLGAQGYGVTMQDGPAPGFDGLSVGPPDQFGSGMIEYQDARGKHLALESQTPELYASLKEAYSAMTGGDATVKQAQGGGYTLLDSGANAPSISDITVWQVGTSDGTVEYQTAAGKFIVSQALTPDLYKQVVAQIGTKAAITTAQGQGYAYLGAGEDPDVSGAGHVDNLGNGVIEFTDAKGDKYVTSQADNPILYGQAADLAQHGTGGSDADLAALRAQYGVEDEGDMNILQKQARDGKGTVQGEAMLDLYNKYNDDVTSNRVAPDSNEAKFVRAMQAQSALQNGYQVLPYSETPLGGGNNSSQDFGDPTQLTGSDMQQMIDPAAVQKQISTLLQDPTVSQDYTGQVSGLLGDIGVPSSKADDLYNQITSPGYAQFLQAAKDKGLGDAAQNQVSSDIATLSALDPARASKAGQILLNNGITADIDQKYGDPSKISDDALSSSALGIFNAVRTEVGTDVNVPRTVIGAVNEIYDTINAALGGPQSTPEGKAQVATLFRDLEAAISSSGPNGKIPDDKLSALIDNEHPSPLEKSGLLTSLQTLNTTGMLGSICGAISLTGAVYNTVSASSGVSPGTSSGDEGTKAVAAAQSWLGFLSFSGNYVKLANHLFDSPFLKDTVSMLGMTTSFKEMWADGAPDADAAKPDPVPQNSYTFNPADPADVNPADLDGAMAVKGKGAVSGETDPGTGLPIETVDGQRCIIAQYDGKDVAIKADDSGGGRYQILQADGTWSRDKAIYLSVNMNGTQAKFIDTAAMTAGQAAGTFETALPQQKLQGIYEGVGEQVNTQIAATDTPGTPDVPGGSGGRAAPPPTPAGTTTPDPEASLDSLVTGEAAADGAKLPASSASKIAGTISKSLGYSGDFGGGVAGVVLGALSLKSATTPEQKTVDALGIESGLLLTADGAVEFASMGGLVIAGAGLIASVAFAASAIVGILGAAVAFAVQHKKEADAANGQTQFFSSLAGDGLMQPDWTNKLEYARYEIHQHGGRDAPKDESIFNFQSAEYAHFVATSPQHGSSQNRLDPKLHVPYDASKSTANPSHDTSQDSQLIDR